MSGVFLAHWWFVVAWISPQERSPVKPVITFASVVVLVGALAGCAADPVTSLEASGTGTASGGCTPSGAEVESITFGGEFGSAPELSFDAPLEVLSTQRSVIVEGEGAPVTNGDDLVVNYSLYNAASGALIEESGYDELSPTVLTLNTEVPSFVGVSLTAACSTVGSRVAGLIPPHQAFGIDGAPEFGLQAGEALLFVVDILDIKPPAEPALESLSGVAEAPPEGFPAIEYAESGEPTVTIPEGDVPEEFAVATVLVGEGAVVGAGDVVVVHYHGVNWNTGEVFDSSWTRGEPASFPTGGVIPGFRDGLIDQTVGSRVVIVIPSELGYGPTGGTEDGSIGPEDTILFVVDILGVQ
jgi:peptidylprolyl isomerase